MVAPSKVRYPLASPRLKAACHAAAGARPHTSGPCCGVVGHHNLPPKVGYNGDSAGVWYVVCADCHAVRHLSDAPTAQNQAIIDDARATQTQEELAAQRARQVHKAEINAAVREYRQYLKDHPDAVPSGGAAPRKLLTPGQASSSPGYVSGAASATPSSPSPSLRNAQVPRPFPMNVEPGSSRRSLAEPTGDPASKYELTPDDWDWMLGYAPPNEPQASTSTSSSSRLPKTAPLWSCSPAMSSKAGLLGKHKRESTSASGSALPPAKRSRKEPLDVPEGKGKGKVTRTVHSLPKPRTKLIAVIDLTGEPSDDE